MRHLMYALEGSGNFVEAERSLDAYILIVENEKKTLARKHSDTANHSDDKDIIRDVDSDEDILTTMISGIRILVKYQNNGKKAVTIAKTLEQNARSWNIENPKVLGLVWHAIGIANSLWSMQSMSFCDNS